MTRERAVDISYFLLRMVSGLMMFQPGAMKLFGWYGGLPAGVTVPMWSQIWIGGILELIGGIAIMLGLFTRPVAFVLSGEMAVAYWQFHFPQGSWPVQNQGVPAVLLCFIFLYMAARGSGTWGLDALLARRRNRE